MNMNDENISSTTPLDLLLNAITGSSDFTYTTQPGVDVPRGDEELNLTSLLAAHAQAEGTPAQAGRDQPLDGAVDKLRQQKIARALSAQIVLAAKHSGTAEDPQADVEEARLAGISHGIISKVEVWHPKTGQKSYGKERRILCPPPILHVAGPLFSLLTSATLATTSQSEASDTPIASSTQTQRIPLSLTEESKTPQAIIQSSKKQSKEARRQRLREAALRAGFGATLAMDRSKDMPKQRQALADGLGFAGMWIGEEKGKGKSRGKQYHLELTLSQPGVEDPGFTTPARQDQGETGSSEVIPPAVDDQISPDDAAALRDVFGQANLEDLQAFEDGLVNHSSDLVEHLQEQSQTISEVDKGRHSPNPIEADLPPQARSWATFTSNPLTIVTKPSQKTIKARSMASCLSDRDIISLYTRLHSQTVRTKYMKLETGSTSQLSSKTGKWSPFAIEVVERAATPAADGRPAKRAKRASAEPSDHVLTYGSVVRLVDVKSGIKTDPLRLVKVEKNEAIVGEDYGQPVSELQRVGLARVGGNDESARWFLSAPGARMGGGELRPEEELLRKIRPKTKKATSGSGTIGPADEFPAMANVTEGEENNGQHHNAADFDLSTSLPTTLHDTEQATIENGTVEAEAPEDEDAPVSAMKRKRTKRNALAKAAAEEDEEGSNAARLGWAQALRETREIPINDDGVPSTRTVNIEKIEDWMCWLVAGVSSFSFSFFDGYSGFGTLPSAPLDPIPRILADPQLVAETNTLHLVLSDFYSPDEFDAPRPFEVYLGPIGPLTTSSWRSTAPPQDGLSSGQPPLAVLYDERDGEMVPNREVRSAFPATTKHVLVVVEMPDAPSILRVMEELATKAREGDPGHATTNEIEGENAPVPIESQDNTVDAPGDIWDSHTQEAEADQIMSSEGELTIQQALQNAQAAQATLDLDGSMIDPTLTSTQPELSATKLSSPPAPFKSGEVEDVIPVIAVADQEQEPPPIGLHVPERQKKTELVALPLVLLRRRDGAGFGVGRSVVAERLVDGEGEWRGNAQWGLRLVET
ncbi:beta-trefoil DNA-binding domain-domain-containing protein [Naematelia encephala]|uniref:Beta-trefoil DNA-binding domain-domain-containing protein n=1 Tax=Naematelia encephala TaxID=71784 RepID=A0A1Y2BHU0_9TREE|nr:beta-trefoil DNA-binding domain-domain-containing protein [Naematelia encephala]